MFGYPQPPMLPNIFSIPLGVDELNQTCSSMTLSMMSRSTPIPPLLRGGLPPRHVVPPLGTRLPSIPPTASMKPMALCPPRGSRGVAGANYPLPAPSDPPALFSPLENEDEL